MKASRIHTEGRTAIRMIDRLSRTRQKRPRLPAAVQPRLVKKSRVSPALLSQASQHADFLKFLDDMECPLLMLPLKRRISSVRHIGFFTDIRFTDVSTLSLLRRTAGALSAPVTLINVTDNGLPEMTGSYARKYFLEVIEPKLAGLDVRFFDLGLRTGKAELENVVGHLAIDLAMAVRGRRDLLYRLTATAA